MYENDTINLTPASITPVAISGLTLNGDNGDNGLQGGSGEDWINGLGGNDYLEGMGGDDTINGGSGNDELLGGSGDDVLNGGSGDDYFYGGSGDDKIDGGDGLGDQVFYSNASAGVRVTLRPVGPQNTGGGGVDWLFNIENVVGSRFDDQLTGNELANLMIGNFGKDILIGDRGADELWGGTESDGMRGGLGNDVLYGGTGVDIFRFDSTLNASTNVDRIKDWDTGGDGDKLQLDNWIFRKLVTTGVLSAANFHASSTGNAVAVDDFILFNTTNHTLYYDADGSGAGAKVAFAILGAGTTVTASDINII